MGLLFLVVGGADILLTWLPAGFGDREWEFGTVTAAFNAHLQIAFGMALLVPSAIGGGTSRRIAYVATSALLGIAVIGATALYATTLPIAFGAVAEGPVRVGLQKAVVKTLIQGAVFSLWHFGLAGMVGRSARDRARPGT